MRDLKIFFFTFTMKLFTIEMFPRKKLIEGIPIPYLHEKNVIFINVRNDLCYSTIIIQNIKYKLVLLSSIASLNL